MVPRDRIMRRYLVHSLKSPFFGWSGQLQHEAGGMEGGAAGGGRGGWGAQVRKGTTLLIAVSGY